MEPKPSHLGPEYASQFRDPSVVEAYRFRPPYPEETFEILLALGDETPGTVLDAGCGEGALARGLAPHVERVDAVDVSPGMIEAGRRKSGGDHPAIRWIEAPLETAELAPPYDLVVAGQSLHWMEWSVVVPRIRAVLVPGGVLALVSRRFASTPWDPALRTLLARYSTNREYAPYDLVEELTRRGLFHVRGRRCTAEAPWRQALDEHVESFHSANGFSRDRMGEEEAEAFDGEVRALVSPHAPGGGTVQDYGSEVVWGEPLDP